MTAPRDRHGPGADPIDAKDRLLEFALEELARERSHGDSRHAGPDMVARVRAAHARGMRGQDVSSLGSEGETRQGVSTRGRLRQLGRSPATRPRSAAAARTGSRKWSDSGHRNVAAAALFFLLAGAIAWALLRGGSDGSEGAPTEDPGWPFIADGTGDPFPDTGPNTGPDTNPETPEPEESTPTLVDTNPGSPLLPMQPLAALLLEDRPGFYTDNRQALRSEEIQAEILLALKGSPDDWPFFRSEVADVLESRFTSLRTGRRLISLAKSAPEAAGTDLARALWLLIPQYFSTEDLVLFGDRRLFEFERELVSLAVEPDPEFLAQRGGPDLLANAWLLNRGDRRGLTPLSALIDDIVLDYSPKRDLEALQRGVLGIALAARIVQAAEGGDAWDRAHRRVSVAVLACADLANYEAASMALATLEYMRQTPAPPEFPIGKFRSDFLEQLDSVEWYSEDRSVLEVRLGECALWGP